jgi:hypothetical protein
MDKTFMSVRSRANTPPQKNYAAMSSSVTSAFFSGGFQLHVYFRESFYYTHSNKFKGDTLSSYGDAIGTVTSVTTFDILKDARELNRMRITQVLTKNVLQNGNSQFHNQLYLFN